MNIKKVHPRIAALYSTVIDIIIFLVLKFIFKIDVFENLAVMVIIPAVTGLIASIIWGHFYFDDDEDE